MRPIVNGLVADLGSSLNVVVLDMDRRAEREEADDRYSQTRFPSYVLLDRDGKVVRRLFGELPEAQLRAAMLEVAAPAR